MLRACSLILVCGLLTAVETSGESAALARARAAFESPGTNQVFEIESSLHQVKPGERSAIFALLADHKITGIESILDDGLNDKDPAVRASAMGAVAKNWPTQASHLVLLRRELDSPDAQVAQAALGAIANIGDDRETGKILSRMESGGAVGQQARVSLARLYGSDLGEDVGTWRTAFQDRQQRLEPMIASAKAVFSGSDNQAIRASLHQLLMIHNPPRSDVAEAIAPLLTNADPEIARLAREGLKNLGGGMAALAIKVGAQPVTDFYLSHNSAAPVANPVQVGPDVDSKKEPLRDNSDFYVIIAVACFGLTILWLMFRTPVKDTVPMKVLTGRYKRKKKPS